MTVIGYFTKEESGQGLVEYALILLLVAIAVFASVVTFGTSLAGYYQSSIDALFP